MAGRKLASVLIVSGAVLLVVTALIGLRLTLMAPQPDEGARLPVQVAGHSLVRQSNGAQAISELNRLHGREFAFLSGAVGVYGAGEQATLWVSGLGDAPDAAKMIVAMRDRIATGNSPFQPLDAWEDGDRTVYELVGMGQRHFYFQSRLLVIWLAADPELADEAIAEVLGFYP